MDTLVTIILWLAGEAMPFENDPTTQSIVVEDIGAM